MNIETDLLEPLDEVFSDLLLCFKRGGDIVVRIDDEDFMSPLEQFKVSENCQYSFEQLVFQGIIACQNRY